MGDGEVGADVLAWPRGVADGLAWPWRGAGGLAGGVFAGVLATGGLRAGLDGVELLEDVISSSSS